MKQITISELKKNPWNEVEKELPLEILVEGAPVAIIASKNDFLYLGNLHIRVRNMLLAQAKRATQAEPSGRVTAEATA